MQVFWGVLANCPFKIFKLILKVEQFIKTTVSPAETVGMLWDDYMTIRRQNKCNRNMGWKSCSEPVYWRLHRQFHGVPHTTLAVPTRELHLLIFRFRMGQVALESPRFLPENRWGFGENLWMFICSSPCQNVGMGHSCQMLVNCWVKQKIGCTIATVSNAMDKTQMTRPWTRRMDKTPWTTSFPISYLTRPRRKCVGLLLPHAQAINQPPSHFSGWFLEYNEDIYTYIYLFIHLFIYLSIYIYGDNEIPHRWCWIPLLAVASLRPLAATPTVNPSWAAESLGPGIFWDQKERHPPIAATRRKKH